ncbi:MAG TPA: pyrroloquinoline quinone-dependent dehydrogenase [Candidatus Acidoferrales bacterium]|nr:pyrroloquinoline quinone-dependent dehydrogenase [Candidatus Acidoferrales bacterium]
MRIREPRFLLVAVVLALGAGIPNAGAQSPANPAGATKNDWAYYGHDTGGTRYSPLAQINRDNVSKLKVAWTFHAGDISDGSGRPKRSGLETTPILVDGTLYLTTAFNRVFAVNPETGKQLWVYDPMIDLAGSYGDGLINRGVATWLDATRAKGKRCRRRIFEATLDARLIALDGATGDPCPDFGNRGQISLRGVARYIPAEYHMTSPPLVIDDMVVVGSAIDDNARVDMPSGVVRAFDARTGALRWQWEPLPPNDADSATPSTGKVWRTGAGNAWSVMVVDPERDLIFVPTGSASPDYYGGMRVGDDKWADSVVALRAKTGELAWGFQLVHHDLWDYDSASPPLLATLQHDGKSVPVVIQGNKTGFLYVLNRDTGVPVFPVEERPVPQSDVPGEVTSATQPFPLAPPALVPQKLSADDAWGITPTDRDYCRERMKGLRNGGLFTPPSLQGSLSEPGNVGGMNWSGYAFDPHNSLLLVNSNDLPAEMGLVAADKYWDAAGKSTDLEYTQQYGAPYGMFRTFLFAKAHHLPCAPPPWGTLTAVDMAQGTIRWQVPLGSIAPSKPIVPAGAPSLGGPIVTAGGLVFIAGTIIDPAIRAFDVETGKEIWKFQLPTSGAATPMTYQVRPGGKQYLVIAAGGHSKVTQEKQSDQILAFTLP